MHLFLSVIAFLNLFSWVNRIGSASLPRHHHPLQPRLPIIAARARVKDGDAETTPAIAMRAPQPKL
jgi:hypothetical protein